MTSRLEEILTGLVKIEEKPEDKPRFFLDYRQKYDRDYFVERADAIFDLEGYMKAVQESKGMDVGAVKDLRGSVMANMPETMLNQLRNPTTPEATEMRKKLESDIPFMLEFGDGILGDERNSMAVYVAYNRDKIMEELSAEQLFEFFSSVPLYKTGIEKYDRARELRAKLSNVQEAMKEGKSALSVVGKEVEKEIKKYTPGLEGFIRTHYSTMAPVIAGQIIREMQEEYGSLFMDKQGRLDREEIEGCLRANYKVLEDFIEHKDTLPEIRDKIWSENLKKHYLILGKVLYSAQKKAWKVDKNEDKEEQKATAEGLGIAT
jgi:hypothetical protein